MDPYSNHSYNHPQPSSSQSAHYQAHYPTHAPHIAPTSVASPTHLYRRSLSPPINMLNASIHSHGGDIGGGTDQLVSPMSSASEPAISLRGMMCVYQFTPKEGEASMPLTVRLDFRNPFVKSTTPLHLRIVLDEVPIVTSMTSLISPGEASTGIGDYELHAILPPKTPGGSASVKLSVQVLQETAEDIVDSVDFGYFTYWEPAQMDHTAPNSPFLMPIPSSPGFNRTVKRERDDDFEERIFKRTLEDPPSPTPKAMPPSMFGPINPPAASPPPTPTRSRPVPKARQPTTLIRTSQLDHAEDALCSPSDKVSLVIKGDLDGMAVGWSDEDFIARRRLVQFWRRQDGSQLHLAFRPISQADYVEGSIVVSCIFREDTDECYITSVDIIFLLESLVATRFSVEEKNRIRRNLEGLKPQTVSKNKKGSENFFALIMGFPFPRPRNIEKDVKVFPWRSLRKALEKIVNKYSHIPSDGKLVEGGSHNSHTLEEEDDNVQSKVELHDPALLTQQSQNYLNAYSTETASSSTQLIYPDDGTRPSYTHSPSSSIHSYSTSAPTAQQIQPHLAPGAPTHRSTHSTGSLLDLPSRPNGSASSNLVRAMDYGGLSDNEVSEFFNSAAGYMGTGTGGGHSPQSNYSEFDGIHGRSFHHQIQQEQRRAQEQRQQQQQQQQHQQQHQNPIHHQHSASQPSFNNVSTTTHPQNPYPYPQYHDIPAHHHTQQEPEQYRHQHTNTIEGIHRINAPLYVPVLHPALQQDMLARSGYVEQTPNPTDLFVEDGGFGGGASTGSGTGYADEALGGWVSITNHAGAMNSSDSPPDSSVPLALYSY